MSDGANPITSWVPLAPAPPPRCGNCRYFLPVPNGTLAGFDGKCRRYPRVPIVRGGMSVYAQPNTNEDDWCGEHRYP